MYSIFDMLVRTNIWIFRNVTKFVYVHKLEVDFYYLTTLSYLTVVQRLDKYIALYYLNVANCQHLEAPSNFHKSMGFGSFNIYFLSQFIKSPCAKSFSLT